MEIKLTWLYAFRDWRDARRQAKEEGWQEWHRWFAWRPKVIDGYFVWLGFIERRRVHNYRPAKWDRKIKGGIDWGCDFWWEEYR